MISTEDQKTTFNLQTVHIIINTQTSKCIAPK